MATLPFTFTPDTVADATQVNANFQSVANPTGPLGVGVTPPANANPGRIFANGGVTLQPVALVAGGDVVGHFMVNLYVDTAGVFRYLTNGPGFELNCDTTTNSWLLRQAPSGTAGTAVTSFQRTVTFQPGLVSVDPLAVMPGTPGDLVGHFMVNATYDPVQAGWVYTSTAPAFDFVADATTDIYIFRMAPSGTAGTLITWTRVSQFILAPAVNATNFSLLTNEAGVITLQTVMVGPANSGPGSSGRVLYVPV
jgi:hypothetical protein